MMNIVKDLLRLAALVLLVRAVYLDSIACAISAGTLYMGGFENVFHIKSFLKNKFNPEKIPATVEAPVISDNVYQLRRG